MKPFHLSFAVPNLKETQKFYVDVLGCSVGRVNSSWVDILFFSHQITIHQASDKISAIAIDHFGPILSKSDWLTILERCKSKNVEFAMQPSIKNAGANEESGKFIILDPAQNVIEFKFYNSFEDTVS